MPLYSITGVQPVVLGFSMRSRASFRRRRRETTDDSRDLIHDAHNTGSMVAIQDLVEKARHASEEVQKGIIRAGLQRHLYPFEPRQKQIDAIWHLVQEGGSAPCSQDIFPQECRIPGSTVVLSRRHRPYHHPFRSNRTGAVHQDPKTPWGEIRIYQWQDRQD